MAHKMTPADALFACCLGGVGITYCDRRRERHGDYARAAFISFGTLVLEFEKDCPDDLREMIGENAATLQTRRGDEYEISTAGQMTTLGHALPVPEIVDLTGADWIWPQAETPGTWHEISKAHWWQQYEVLPPIYAPSGFLMCEAKRHDGDGVAVRAYYVETHGRHFVRQVRHTKSAPARALAELLAALNTGEAVHSG